MGIAAVRVVAPAVVGVARRRPAVGLAPGWPSAVLVVVLPVMVVVTPVRRTVGGRRGSVPPSHVGAVGWSSVRSAVRCRCAVVRCRPAVLLVAVRHAEVAQPPAHHRKRPAVPGLVSRGDLTAVLAPGPRPAAVVLRLVPRLLPRLVPCRPALLPARGGGLGHPRLVLLVRAPRRRLPRAPPGAHHHARDALLDGHAPLVRERGRAGLLGMLFFVRLGRRSRGLARFVPQESP